MDIVWICRRGAGLVLTASLASLLAMLTLAPAQAQSRSAERFESAGPYEVIVIAKPLCCDSKGNAVEIHLPRARRAGETFPIVTWGNGTWAKPEKYAFLLRHLASWGMIVVATRDSSVGTGETLLDALALLANSEAGSLADRRRIAAIGHSQGASGAFNAAAAPSSGIATTVLIDLPGRRLCNREHCAAIPTGLQGKQSVLFLSGEKDPLSSPEMVDSYFSEVPAGRLRAKAAVAAADHNDIQGQPACQPFAIGCRNGVGAFLPYVTAWLRWQLTTDKAAAAVFTGRAAPFARDPHLTGAVIAR
jgi:pimeloyl-ACP methyl ester carboxylesterase